MLRASWRLYVAIGAFIALAAIGSIAWVHDYRVNQRLQRQEATGQTNKNAEHFQRECADLTGSSLFLCVLDVAQAERNAKSAEYDLEAQQDMAAWALGVLLVSIGGLVLTGFGLWALFRTLEATRDMSVATREIGERQTAAYVLVPRIRIEDSLKGSEESYKALRFTAIIENVGQSPGVKLSYSAWLEVADIDYTNPIKVGNETTSSFNAPNVPPNKEEEMGFWIYSMQNAIDEVGRRDALIAAGDRTFDILQLFFLRFDIFYEDVSGNRFKSEYRGWFAEAPNDNDIGTFLLADYDSDLKLFFRIEDLGEKKNPKD